MHVRDREPTSLLLHFLGHFVQSVQSDHSDQLPLIAGKYFIRFDIVEDVEEGKKVVVIVVVVVVVVVVVAVVVVVVV